MRTLAILIIFFLLGCKDNKLIKVYSWQEYQEAISKYPEQEIVVIDTICQWEIKIAQQHIKEDSLVYYNYHYTSEVTDELKILLKPYHIFPRYKVSSCIAAPKGFTENCYEKTIDEEIEKRHGKNWIDSLKTVALKNYVIKHPNEPYIENGIDLRKKYLNK